MRRRALVASADPELRARIFNVLSSAGLEVSREVVDAGLAALACATEDIDVAIVDEALTGAQGGSVTDLVDEVGGRSRVVVVVHEGSGAGPGRVALSSPDFDEALLEAVGPAEERGPIRLFVVDDHEMVRRGIRDLADEEPDLEIAGEWDRAAGCIAEVGRVRPDVVLLDMRLPDGDGVELCRDLRSVTPDIPCVIFTAHSDEDAILRATMAGASGYLLKHAPSEELVDGIRRVAAGEALLTPTTTDALMLMLAGDATRKPALSPRQEMILDLVVDGLTNAEIAERVHTPEPVVRAEVAAILDELGVRSRPEAS